jgi:hypothetical protein
LASLVGELMAARLTKWTPEIVRQRIKTAHIVQRMQKHISGKLEMSATQVRACEILLRKTLPDQSSIAHTGQIEMVKPDELTDSQLAHIASSGSPGVIEPKGSQKESGSVH